MIRLLHMGFGGAEMAVNIMDLLDIGPDSSFLEIVIFVTSLSFSESFRKAVRKIGPVRDLGRYFFILPVCLLLSVTPANAGSEAALVQYVFLLDTSGSMVWNSRLIKDPLDLVDHKIFLFEQVKRDALQLIKNIPESQPATISFVPFDREIHDEKTFLLQPGATRAEALTDAREYLAGLEATGRQTHIFSAIQKIITRFRHQGRETGETMATTIFVLTDGVDTEPNYPDNLRTALEMFRDWGENSEDKPWLYTLHILPDNLTQEDQHKLALEEEAFAETPRARMVTSVIGEETGLQVVHLRIPELDFGYWQPGNPMPERRISFDFLTTGTGQDEISLVFIPRFNREENRLPSGMDVLFPSIRATSDVAGNSTYLINLPLNPTLVNPVPGADFLIQGIFEIRAGERVLVQPETIGFRLHVGQPPIIHLRPIQEGTDILTAGELPAQISRIFRVIPSGRIDDGDIETVTATLDGQGTDLFSGKPVLQLTDREGFETGHWQGSRWSTAEFARIILPLNPAQEPGPYPAEIIFRVAQQSPFLLSNSVNTAEPIDLLRFPISLEITAPPEPGWHRIARMAIGLALLFGLCGLILWWRRPVFQEVELQLLPLAENESLDTRTFGRIIETLIPSGRKRMAIGSGTGRFEDFEIPLFLRPARIDNRHELQAVRLSGDTPLYHYRTDDQGSPRLQGNHATAEFQLRHGDILACGDLAIKICSVSYTDDIDETE